MRDFISYENEQLAKKAGKITAYVLAAFAYLATLAIILNLISLVLPAIAIVLCIGLFIFHVVFLVLWIDKKVSGDNRRRRY